MRFMGFKKLISTFMVCGLVATSLAEVAPLQQVKPVGVKAADASNVFSSVNVANSYKSINENNPCQTQRFAADPGVMEYNGRVYVYATHDGDVKSGSVAKNTYGQITQLDCFSSADLVNWTDHGQINVARSGGAASWAGNSWAPCATHKTINGKEKFFIYFANNANGIGVLTADSPTGPWRDPIGRALISRSTPNCNNVEWLFDPAVFVDTDGTGYLYFGGGVPSGQNEHPRTARCVKLGNDMTSIVGTPQMIDAPWLFEDAGINKVGNTYYYSYCTNWAGGPLGNARIAYMTSSNPLGPFTYKGICFNNQGEFLGEGGNNHHTIVQFKGKHYIFYHSENLNKKVYGSCLGYRTTFVNEMPFSNGTFGPAKATMGGVSQVQTVNAFENQRAANMAWQGGINVYGNGGTTTVAYNRGDWTGVSGVAFGSQGATSVKIRAASANGAWIKICEGSAKGTALGYVQIPATGGNSNFRDITETVNKITGTKKLFFVASGDVVIDSWQFGGSGVVIPSTQPSVNPSQDPQPSVQPVSDVKEGWYYIKNVLAQKYLTVANNEAKAVTNVEMRTGSGVAGQKWYVKYNSEGYMTLKSGLGEFMIDVANGKDEDGANIQIYDGYGGNAQQLILQKTGTDGIYTIGTRASSGTKVLDVYNHSKDDGANVCQWTKYGNPNQQFIFEAIGTTSPSPSPSPSPAPSTQPSAVPSTQPSTQPSTVPSTQPSTQPSDGVAVTYKVTGDWGSGYQGEIVVTNKSSQTFNPWTLTFTCENKISSLWGAGSYSQTGSTVTVSAPSWATALAPGQSVTLGFVADGSANNSPTNFAFK